MAIKNEAFLVLEFSLAKKLDTATKKEYLPKVKRAASAARKGDFNNARDEINSINLTKAVIAQRQFIELIGMQAILFGARDFSAAKDTGFAGKPPPEQLKKATDTIIRMIVLNTTELIKKSAHRLLDLEEVAQKESEFVTQKGATSGFVRSFTSNVSSNGKSMIDIGSSLHTSRLASWGFTTEASLLGHTSFMVSEVMDGRTCPVCSAMNGKVFPVDTAKLRLEGVLDVTDPEQLKSMAPWPNQSKQGIKKLQSMSDGELINAGWDTPPYHPRCRGVLRRTDKEAPLSVPTIPLPIATEAVEAQTVREVVPLLDVADTGFYDKGREFVTSNGIREQAGSIEYAWVYDKNGSAIIAKRGEKNAVAFSPEEMTAMKEAEDVVLVHNHPSSQSLSPADFSIAGNINGTIVAASNQGNEYLGRMLQPKGFIEKTDKISDLVYKKADTLLKGKITVAEAQSNHWHGVNLVLRDLGVVEYEAILATQPSSHYLNGMKEIVEEINRGGIL